MRQQNHLSAFLYLLAAEGLVNTVQKDTNLGDLTGFQVNQSIIFNIHQFVDGPVLLCDPTWANLLSLKGISRGLKLTSSLCVNLAKSKIFCTIVKNEFLQVASSFITRCIGTILFFSFPRTHIKVNPRSK